MPVRDYRKYAQSDKGKAARARAHQRYIAKRRALNQQSTPAFVTFTHIAGLLTSWGRNDQPLRNLTGLPG